MIEKLYKQLLRTTLVLIYLIGITFLSSLIVTKSISSSILNLSSYPLHFVLDLSVVIFIYSIIGAFATIPISCGLTFFIVSIFSFIHSIKLNMRGIGLIPEDIVLAKELTDIIDMVINPKILITLIVTLIVTIIIWAIVGKLLAKRGFIHRLVLLIIGVGIGGFLYSTTFFIDFTGNFLYNFATYSLYSENNRLVIDECREDSMLSNEEYSSTELKPNIIVIMSEAFWNPKLLEGVSFNKNPISNIERLQREGIYGYVESPEFGGGTANVEFEMLTGYSAHYYRPGYLLYPNLLKHKAVPSMVSLLNDQGYETKAIHSYKGWYYNRNKVYSNLGFNEFISKEVLDSSRVKGLYISDEYVTDTIIKQLENKDDDPLFLFTVTMQNHGPYNDNRYSIYRDRIRVTNRVNYKNKQILETFTQGVYDADKALGKLINYISNQDEPTMVLFFGDHLPILGDNNSIYREYNFYNKSERGSYVKLYSVPFLLWSNYKKDSEDIGIINASFLGSYILKYAELELNDYFKFLDRMFMKVAAISRTYMIDREGNLINRDNEQYIKYNEIYKCYQFNEMDRYVKEENDVNGKQN